MGIFDVIFIGVGLAMDAAAVSMTNGMVYRGLRKRTYIAMPLLFGFFQTLMPVLGFYAGSIFTDIMTRYSGPVVFIILAGIGANMIREGVSDMRKGDEEEREIRNMTPVVLLMQAVATSIDALAVGVGFSAAGEEVFAPAAIIGVVTATVVIAAILVGRRFGDLLGSRAEILGGIILVIIGVKALI